MMRRLNRFLIVVYAFWCYLTNYLHRKVDNKEILVIFQQVFGDSIFLVPLLRGFSDRYPKRLGYKVILVCRPSIKNFLIDVADLPSDLEIETVDYSKYLNDYDYFKSITRRYRFSSGISIVPGTSLSAEIFSTTLAARKKYGLIPAIKRTHPRLMVFFQRLAYTNPVVADRDTSTIMQKKKLMKVIGLNDYRATLTRLKSQESLIKGRYCVICPGASMPMKKWPIDRFVQIINEIVEKYKMDIYLCGGKGEEILGEQIIKGTKYPARLHNKIGITTYKEWASIIQYSSFVLGNDSATVHIGVGYQKKVLCINGLYEKGIMYPYQVDELKEDESLPIIVSLKSMPCENCRTKGYFAGYGNSDCFEAIQGGMCALCIDNIKVEKVIESIKTVLN